MNLRRADVQKDYDRIWDIFKEVIATGDTYAFEPNSPKESLTAYWFAAYMNTFVVEVEDDIVGTYIFKANQIGWGNPIAIGVIW